MVTYIYLGLLIIVLVLYGLYKGLSILFRKLGDNKSWLKYGIVFITIDLILLLLVIFGGVFLIEIGLIKKVSENLNWTVYGIMSLLDVFAIPPFLIGALIGWIKSKNQPENRTR